MTLHLRQLLHDSGQGSSQTIDVDRRLDQQRGDATALGLEHRQQQVCRLDELIVATDGQRLGIGQSRLKPAGEFIHAHRVNPCG